MGTWTKEQKLDALIELVTEDHWPASFYDDDAYPSAVYRCHCGDAGSWPDHLKQVIANEGLIEDDPGAQR